MRWVASTITGDVSPKPPPVASLRGPGELTAPVEARNRKSVLKKGCICERIAVFGEFVRKKGCFCERIYNKPDGSRYGSYSINFLYLNRLGSASPRRARRFSSYSE